MFDIQKLSDGIETANIDKCAGSILCISNLEKITIGFYLESDIDASHL
jgi:hypothetical protein